MPTFTLWSLQSACKNFAIDWMFRRQSFHFHRPIWIVQSSGKAFHRHSFTFILSIFCCWPVWHTNQYSRGQINNFVWIELLIERNQFTPIDWSLVNWRVRFSKEIDESPQMKSKTYKSELHWNGNYGYVVAFNLVPLALVMQFQYVLDGNDLKFSEIKWRELFKFCF